MLEQTENKRKRGREWPILNIKKLTTHRVPSSVPFECRLQLGRRRPQLLNLFRRDRRRRYTSPMKLSSQFSPNGLSRRRARSGTDGSLGLSRSPRHLPTSIRKARERIVKAFFPPYKKLTTFEINVVRYCSTR